MSKLIGSAVVGQSGGPTAAINSSLVGVIRNCLDEERSSGYITRVYGMKNGIEGFLKEQMYDLSEIFSSEKAEDDLLKLSRTPSSALGSCRKKLPDPEKDPETFEKIFGLFAKYDIRYFFYIGGNDSMDTVSKISAYSKKTGYEIRVIGVPKTIDNDLIGTDHTPGFGSAGKYIATTMQEILCDCAVYQIPAVTIVEIMGRDSGWLTTTAGLPRLISGIGPDYIYLPETFFSDDSFIEDLKKALEKHPNVVVAVSEGIRYENGHYVGEGRQSGVTDVFGHKYLAGTAKSLESLVKEKIGCKVRAVELNISQRCGAHIASWVDLDEAQCCGEKAVDVAIDGKSGCMITMQRAGGVDVPYAISYVPKDVSEIANEVKKVPREFITPEENQVTDECLRYLLPMIQGEVPLTYSKGLPEIYRFES
ncbi:MAG: 6-phosphofructokinase [Clostridia bacterium]|nr:6-phosphofructokinase [Clostridia bacterium]